MSRAGDDDLELARRAAAAGAAVALRHFAALADLPVERKADGSVVTDADRATEAAVCAVLTATRPGDAVLGEEGGQAAGDGTPGGGRRCWVVDPIDGTALFVAGDDRWLVLVALQVDGRTVAAVAAVPAQERLFWAGRGAGAYETHSGGPARRITVAPGPPALPDARLSVFAPRLDLAAPLTAIVPERPWPIHPGLLVARGDLDLAMQTSGQVWDFAATSLIVEEAGGRCTGMDGRPRPATGPALYSGGGAVHDEALRVLRGQGPTGWVST